MATILHCYQENTVLLQRNKQLYSELHICSLYRINSNRTVHRLKSFYSL